MRQTLSPAHWIGALACFMILAWHPFSGGPRVPSAVLALLGLWWLASAGRGLFLRPSQVRWGIVFLALWVPMLVSIAAPFDQPGVLKAIGLAGLFYLAGVAMLETMGSEATLRGLRVAIGALLAFWIADAALQALWGRDLFGIPLNYDGRVVGVFVDRLTLSFLIPLVVPLLIWPLMHRRPWLASALFAVAGWVVLNTGVRGAWVAFFYLAFLFFLELPLRRKGLWALAAAVLVPLALISTPIIQKRIQDSTNIERIDFAAFDRALSYRLTIYDVALKMAREHPLTGVGATAFGEAYPSYSYRPDDPFGPGRLPVFHSHHIYLGALAETGVLGLMGLILIWGLSLRWYLAAPPHARRTARPFGAGLVAVLFPLNSSPQIFDLRWFAVYLLVFAGFLAALGVCEGRGADGGEEEAGDGAAPATGG